MKVWIDGERSIDGQVSVFDYAFVRGDGCFEALRAYSGKVYAVDEHLARLARSAELMALSLPSPALLAEWIETAGAAAGDGVVRMIITRGDPVRESPGRVVVLAEPLPEVPPAYRLLTVNAPWHSAGRPWALAGAKTTSYAPNLSASRQAKASGSDDALLLADDGTVLEGPTYSIGWVSSGVVETPDLDLLILDSITRRHVLEVAAELGIPVRTGRFDVAVAHRADEVFAMSTIKEVSPVVQVDDVSFQAGPVTEQLRDGYRRRVRRDVDRQTGADSSDRSTVPGKGASSGA